MALSSPVNATTNMFQYVGFRPAFFMPRARSIGGIVAQVTIDEQASDDIQITEHPVEQGAPIADHAFKRPAVVTIRAGWSRQWAWDLSAETGVYGLLLSWQASLLPFDVVTGKRIYPNMLIERLQVTTDQHSEFALMATIACRQVIIVSTATTTVAGNSTSNSDHADPAATGPQGDTGTKQPVETGTVNEPLKDPQATPADYSIGPSGQPDVSGPADYQIGPSGETPASVAANNQMTINSAAPPNNPEVPAVGSSDLPMIG